MRAFFALFGVFVVTTVTVGIVTARSSGSGTLMENDVGRAATEGEEGEERERKFPVHEEGEDGIRAG